jgi:hypothetical protein
MSDNVESFDRASDGTSAEIDQKGIKAYWIRKNLRSLDGLPGLLTAPDSKVKPVGVFDKEGPRPKLHHISPRRENRLSSSANIAIGFALGAFATTVLHRVLSDTGKFGMFST